MAESFQSLPCSSSAPSSTEQMSEMQRRTIWKLVSKSRTINTILVWLCSMPPILLGEATLQHPLNLPKSHRYLCVNVCYYSEIPSNLVLKRVSPRIWLPLLTIAWGLVTMCLGFVKNYAGFMAVRAILGIVEGGLLPGMVLYLSGMYTRSGLAQKPLTTLDQF